MQNIRHRNIGSAIQSSLFFIEPSGKSANAYSLALEYLKISGVKEVRIGEGDYGFMVEAKEPGAVSNYLNRRRAHYVHVSCVYALRGAQNGKAAKKA
ncbi:MAG: hypothetical protein QXT43_02385 [Candidatus Micrarchaeaceae archaeon]